MCLLHVLKDSFKAEEVLELTDVFLIRGPELCIAFNAK